jgi:hypothetical protein
MSALSKTPAQTAQEKFSLREQWRQMRRNRADWNEPINEYGIAYYEVLVAQFRTLWAEKPALAPPGLTPSAPAGGSAAGAPVAAIPATDAPPAAGGAGPGPDVAQGGAAAGAAAGVAIPVSPSAPACCHPTRCEQRRAAAAVIDEIINRPLDKIKWSDLFVMEAMLARMQPKEALSIELALIREEYQELVGVEAFTGLKLPLVTIPVDDADYAKALSEYEVLLQELHWNYLSAPSREQERTRLLIAITKSLALLVVVSLALRFTSDEVFPDMNVFGALAICGGLGAWLSAFQRAQSPQVHAAVLLNLRRYKWSRLSFALAPWIGAISAVILAFAFAGDVISGKFFPVIRWTNHLDPSTTNQVLRSLGPSATNKFGTVLPVTNTTANVASNLLAQALSNLVANAPVTSVPALSNLMIGVVSNMVASTSAGSSSQNNRTPQQWHGTGDEQWWFGSDAEYALLLLWAFIAGFSERLVPDLLGRIAKKTDGVA